MTPVTSFPTNVNLSDEHVEMISDLTGQPSGGIRAIISPPATGLTLKEQQQLIAAFIALTLLLADCESRKAPVQNPSTGVND